jgi:hypothetical protein
MENYDRIKSGMRQYRALMAQNTDASRADARFLAQDIAFFAAWLGHYTADGAQPLHDTIHHDGWVGPNPKGYTQDRRIHGRFESQFVDLIKLTDADLTPRMSPARVLDDPFAAILAHLDDASTHVEAVYIMDKRGAYSNPNDAEAVQLVRSQLAKAASLLRDLVYTAWIASGRPEPRMDESHSPLSRSNPLYNPATGTAPPPAGAN